MVESNKTMGEKIKEMINPLNWGPSLKNGLIKFFTGIGAIIAWYHGMAMQLITESRLRIAKILIAIMFFFIMPVGAIGIIGTSFIGIDKITDPSFPVDPEFAEASLNDKQLSEKSVVLLKAVFYQLEKELDSTLGWTPNDIWLDFFDAKADRQMGVIHGSRELAAVLSEKISKMGLGDEEHPKMKEARQKKLAYDEDVWGGWCVGDTEGKYYGGIELIKEYIAEIESGKTRTNITTSDIKDILNVVMFRILGEPYGRLTKRNKGTVAFENEVRSDTLKEIAQQDDEVGKGKVELVKKRSFFIIDDDVYYARGAAIVARDILVAMFNCFTDELSKGGEDNMLVAIDSLNQVIDFNPWWVWNGEHDSMLGDHRSKVSRYYTDAIRRIEDVIKSMKI